ncbi:thioesterase family protein [Paenibacillus sp. FSL R7-0204]|uniref:acyl-CoA thioesterase n=1 Tax=Paenibacillus sp. FSL R7-0204 TaxID=2921675 RepID=UPI0030F983B1
MLDNEAYSVIRRRIYFKDTDAGGVVYFGNACEFIEAGCTEWFRTHALSLKEILDQYQLFFVMKKVEIDFLHPVYYDECIEIRTSVKRIMHYWIDFHTEIWVDQDKRYTAENRMVPVNLLTKAPAPIPEKIYSAVQGACRI